MHIENRLHWVLDVNFKEDKLKISDPDGAAHRTLFNKECLNINRQHQGNKNSLSTKRRRVAWNSVLRA
ncbi:hypothetical protein BIW53_19040 [Pseudoalteromonas byunsanensis]|uniref:Transposase IS4-like domain-containing protein n=1 Tax=Pseudoalteromonas byunsanensis TaxID=327939 RepID=A0A1S1MXS8_9GAMM|nr:hypothetical protein BIW53_19040 [Pseudoalteromonas byunsanensis]